MLGKTVIIYKEVQCSGNVNNHKCNSGWHCLATEIISLQAKTFKPSEKVFLYATPEPVRAEE